MPYTIVKNYKLFNPPYLPENQNIAGLTPVTMIEYSKDRRVTSAHRDLTSPSCHLC